MADTGYNWDAAWTAMPITDGGDGVWTADALADNGTATADLLSLDGKAACEISIAATEDDTGAIDGVCTVYVRFRLLGSDFSAFKLAIKNEAGQELAITVKYRMAMIPAAS